MFPVWLHTFLCISKYDPVFGFYILGCYVGLGFVVTMSSANMGFSFAGPRFSKVLFLPSGVSVFDTRLSNPVCGLASSCCLLGRLCVKFWKLVASHFFTGRALGVKLVVSDRSYIGLFSCACFYITR